MRFSKNQVWKTIANHGTIRYKYNNQDIIIRLIAKKIVRSKVNKKLDKNIKIYVICKIIDFQEDELLYRCHNLNLAKKEFKKIINDLEKKEKKFELFY